MSPWRCWPCWRWPSPGVWRRATGRGNWASQRPSRWRPSCSTTCIYGLIALGFVLIYKATETVNFAQGELMMLAASSA
jgi:hypothetical protein